MQIAENMTPGFEGVVRSSFSASCDFVTTLEALIGNLSLVVARFEKEKKQSHGPDSLSLLMIELADLRRFNRSPDSLWHSNRVLMTAFRQ